MDKEIWRSVLGYEGLYEVSNFGRIKSLDRYIPQRNNSRALRKGKILSQSVIKGGYLRVPLAKNKIHEMCLVHRIVAKAFIPNPQNFKEVNHIDGNKQNNCVNNLEWCSRSENVKHAFDIGLARKRKGELSHRAKFTKSEIEYIRAVYIPRNKQYGARALSRRFNVARTTIERILRNQTYQDEDNPKGLSFCLR